ncbi:MAG: division/cell wall cluster transcriptional repressor MraZ [Chitinophagaceae bacterium]
MQLNGEFEATVDTKSRFLLPGGIKKQLPEGENRFIISRGLDKCLSLYPLKNWEKIVADISSLNQFDPKVRAFRRQFIGGATEVELDSAGRLLLPGSLKEYAGIAKDIVLSSAFTHFEIWDETSYKQLFSDITPEMFSQLANEVMKPQ